MNDMPSLYLYLVNMWSEDIYLKEADLYLVFKSDKGDCTCQTFCPRKLFSAGHHRCGANSDSVN